VKPTFSFVATVTASFALTAISHSAHAAFVATVEQVGENVVITGSGSLDIADLTADTQYTSADTGITPYQGYFLLGSPGNNPVNTYVIPAGPNNFGPGGFSQPTAGSGDEVGFSFYNVSVLVVPDGYVSGAPLAATDTFDDMSYADLGLTPGTYTSNFGTAAGADSFTLQIDPIPEPASMAVIGVGLASVAAVRRRRRD
jgi:PEP-CTERM motif